MFGIKKLLYYAGLLAFVMGCSSNVQAQTVEDGHKPTPFLDEFVSQSGRMNEAASDIDDTPISLKMSSIREKIDAADMIVPERVLEEIKGNFLKIFTHMRAERELEKKFFNAAHSNLSEKEIQTNHGVLLHDYYDSHPFKVYEKKLHELYKRNQDLIRPYIYPVKPPIIDQSKLKDNEKDQYYLAGLKAEYDVSKADLSALENLRAKSRLDREMLKEIEKLHRWPEYLKLPEYRAIDERESIRFRETSEILSPYKDAARKNQRLREKLRKDFALPKRQPTYSEFYNEEFDRLVDKFAVYGVTISEADQSEIKIIFEEMIELSKEKLRLDWGAKLKPDSIEYFNIDVQFSKLSARNEEILKLYEKQASDSIKTVETYERQRAFSRKWKGDLWRR